MTSASSSVPDSEESQRPDLPFPPAPIEELLRVLVKAARAHQLYLPNNPIYKAAIDAARAAFPAVWAHTEELSLEIGETQITWLGHPVMEDHGKSSDSLAWLFFKDGLREIRIRKGFEDQELVKLLGMVQRVRKASPDEDDLLTMFWEADFGFLRYRYVDLGAESAAPLADGAPVSPATAGDIEDATHEAVQESRAAGVVNMADFDGTLYFLDEKEIEYLQNEVQREYREDLRSKVIATLFDIFEQQGDPGVRLEILEHVDTLLVYLLAAGHFRGVTHLLRESQVALHRAPQLLPEHKDALSEIPARLSTPEALSQLLQSLDESQDPPPQEELVELFELFRASALGTLFSWLSKLQNPRLRPLLEQAAGRLAASSTSELVRLIGAPEREIAAEAMRRAGSLKAQGAVPPLAKLLTSEDVELRQTAVQALTEIASPGALQSLERAVDDPDREVRIAAVRALSARAYRPVLGRLETAVKGKAIRGADLTEKMAFFEAFGSLCGEAGIEHLDALLNGKGFLGKREDSEIRACAAIALGRIGTARALEALRRSSSEKDVVVRNAVNRALRGVSA